jgi:hypothetical protein
MSSGGQFFMSPDTKEPLLKSEWVEMGDQPLLAVERTVERVPGRGHLTRMNAMLRSLMEAYKQPR